MNATAIWYGNGAKEPKKFLFATSTSFFNTNLPRDPMNPITFVTFFDGATKALHKQLSTPELHERMLADFEESHNQNLSEKESATRTLINGFCFLLEKLEKLYRREAQQSKAVEEMSMTFLIIINDRVYFRQGGDNLVFGVENGSMESVQLNTEQNLPEGDEYYSMELPADKNLSILVIVNKELGKVFDTELCKELFMNEEQTSNKAQKLFELLKKKNQTGNGGKPQGIIILFVPFVSLLARNLYDCANLDSFTGQGKKVESLYVSRALGEVSWERIEGVQRNFQYVGPPPFPAASAAAAIVGREPSPNVAKTSLEGLLQSSGTLMRSSFEQKGENKDEEEQNKEGPPKREDGVESMN